MESVKLNKKMLNMHPADLLVKLGAVNKEQTLAFPSEVFFSKEDYKKLKENLKKNASKQIGTANKRLVSYSVGVDLLNFGPNESLGEAIKPGYALVDREAIKKHNETTKENSE